MKCPACQHDNEAGALFCEECGSKLVRACASCGTGLKPTAKFCPKCGASTLVADIPSAQPLSRRVADYTPKHLAAKILQSKSALEGERKQVTVLFADIQGSLQLATQLDPERWHQLLERYFAILADAVHRFEGTVNQYTGDGIMALFGAPIAHEDHKLVGCEREMASLESALEAAIAGNGQVVGVVAEAGTGKSRLCLEFVERCRARLAERKDQLAERAAALNRAFECHTRFGMTAQAARVKTLPAHERET